MNIQKLSKAESNEVLTDFLQKIRDEVTKKNKIIEHLDFELHEPYFIRYSCAYLQTNNKDKAILYEKIGRNLFFMKCIKPKTKTQEAIISIFVLDKSTIKLFPLKLLEKLEIVSVEKNSETITQNDFEIKYILH